MAETNGTSSRNMSGGDRRDGGGDRRDGGGDRRDGGGDRRDGGGDRRDGGGDRRDNRNYNGNRNRYQQNNQYNDGGNGDRRDGGGDRRDGGGDRRDGGGDRRDGGGDRRDGGGDRRDGGGDRRFNNRDYQRNSSQQQGYRQSNEQESRDYERVVPTEHVIPTPTPLSQEDITKREDSCIEISSFDELVPRIDLKLIRGLMAYGFENPSKIQQKAIRPMLSGYDLIAQAQSGMGKTATFCIGTLGNIDYEKNEIQAIVLAHTLELAQQIEQVFNNIGKYLEVRIGTATKIMSVRENIEHLTGYSTGGKVPQIVIGTPGRILDMFNKHVFKAAEIKLLVLDEADELLSDGFIQQIRQIISGIAKTAQICLFSATMDVDFFNVTKKFMNNSINILVKREELTLQGIKQYFIDCEKNEYKLETLCDLYSILTISQSIIYCNSYKSVELLTQKLRERNFIVSAIHGNMTVIEREQTMRDFRNCVSRVLISTDLLGRGIDVQQVSIVINYDVPVRYESYIHRIGRSGRHGRKGTAINFVTGYDLKNLNGIEKFYNTVIEPLPADIQVLTLS